MRKIFFKNCLKHQNIFGRKFQKLLRITYPRYQFYTLDHRESFTFLSWWNMFVCNILRFRALYSKFEDYKQTVSWYLTGYCGTSFYPFDLVFVPFDKISDILQVIRFLVSSCALYVSEPLPIRFCPLFAMRFFRFSLGYNSNPCVCY